MVLTLYIMYIMLLESSGFYAYMILELTEEMPPTNIFQIRTVYKLDEKQYEYVSPALNLEVLIFLFLKLF